MILRFISSYLDFSINCRVYSYIKVNQIIMKKQIHFFAFVILFLMTINIVHAQQTHTYQEVKTPATYNVIEEPAQYQTVTKKTVTENGTIIYEEVPAQYQTVTTTKQVAPASYRVIEEPAQYQTITTTRKVQNGGTFTGWTEVDACTAKPERILGKVEKVQQALKNRGYYHGEIYNVWDQATQNALVQFQKANNLPQGDMDVTTLQFLGIEE